MAGIYNFIGLPSCWVHDETDTLTPDTQLADRFKESIKTADEKVYWRSHQKSLVDQLFTLIDSAFRQVLWAELAIR